MRNKIETDLLIGELVYKHLRGEISKDEQEILDSWTENEENTAFFRSLETTDRLYEGMINAQYQDTEAQFRRLQRKIAQKKRRRLLPWWIGVAAVVAMSVGLVWMAREKRVAEQPFEMAQEWGEEDRTVLQTAGGNRVYLADTVKQLVPEVVEKKVGGPVWQVKPVLPVMKYNVLATSSKGKIEVTLSDSSRVWLNAGSELRYPDVFGESRREVYLSGEAYFEVKKNRERPFIVHTGENRIEVLGTQFNVKAGDRENCVATLVEGCIRMHNRLNDTVVLRPGQQADIRTDGSMRVREVDFRYDIAWKKDQFGFHETTLFHILNELSEWYDFTFEIENIALANQIYTAIVPRSRSAGEVLQILQRTQDFVYTEEADGHIVIKGN